MIAEGRFAGAEGTAGDFVRHTEVAAAAFVSFDCSYVRGAFAELFHSVVVPEEGGVDRLACGFDGGPGRVDGGF